MTFPFMLFSLFFICPQSQMLLHLQMVCHVSNSSSRQAALLEDMIAVFLWSTEQHQQRHQTARGEKRQWSEIIHIYQHLPQRDAICKSLAALCLLHARLWHFNKRRLPVAFRDLGRIQLHCCGFVCLNTSLRGTVNWIFIIHSPKAIVRSEKWANFAVLLSHTCIIMINISSSCRDLPHRMSFQLEWCEVQLKKNLIRKRLIN